MTKSIRSTTTRDRHRRIIARGHPPCAICKQPIDYTLKWPDRWCYVVDHITALDRGGTDTLDNKQPAHHKCNRDKSNRHPDWKPGVTFTTDRHWA